jgi:hypothetical protein
MTHTVVKGKEKVETEYRITAICYNLLRSLSILGEKHLKKRLQALVAPIVGAIRLVLSLYPLRNYEKRLTYSYHNTTARRPK